jgi:hypothetical protein
MTTVQLLTQYSLVADAKHIRQSRVFINTVLDLTQCVEQGFFFYMLTESLCRRGHVVYSLT